MGPIQSEVSSLARDVLIGGGFNDASKNVKEASVSRQTLDKYQLARDKARDNLNKLRQQYSIQGKVLEAGFTQGNLLLKPFQSKDAIYFGGKKITMDNNPQLYQTLMDKGENR